MQVVEEPHIQVHFLLDLEDLARTFGHELQVQKVNAKRNHCHKPPFTKPDPIPAVVGRRLPAIVEVEQLQDNEVGHHQYAQGGDTQQTQIPEMDAQLSGTHLHDFEEDQHQQ